MHGLRFVGRAVGRPPPVVVAVVVVAVVLVLVFVFFLASGSGRARALAVKRRKTRLLSCIFDGVVRLKSGLDCLWQI